MRILIANRGEIARRIIRTAHRLDHDTVAVFGEPDADAPFVREATTSVALGSVKLEDSYLSTERILSAAEATGSDAVHPGYGFLSENTDFAHACIDAGLIWIGPDPRIIADMGSKIKAREIAESSGVPTIPGWSESQDPEELAQAATRIGYPILVKASAGGGGKGIRIAHDESEFANALSEASAEAERAFGDGSVIVERCIERPRHIEVQVIGDKRGKVLHLGTRECSVQRRYQKLLEEAPAPNLSPEIRSEMTESARRLAAAGGYDSAGTVEFIVDDTTGEYFFLEMNTRLQVEHPVTEAITGLDLVELMIHVAAGEVLPPDVPVDSASGHAIEARILAEDPLADFAPQIGPIHQLHVPDGVRWDAAIEVGSEITPHYDSMIAKLIVRAATRDLAIEKLRWALDELLIDGVTTTARLHRWLVDQPDFRAGSLTTRFLDENEMEVPSQEETDHVHAQAAAAWAAATSDPASTSPWFGSTRSLTPHQARRQIGLEDANGDVVEVAVEPEAGVERSLPPYIVDVAERRVAINHGGATHSFVVPTRSQRWAPSKADRTSSDTAITAPFPALVAEVHVEPGDEVQGDHVVVVIEAMKMLHSLRSNGASTIAEVRVAPGDQVATGDVLVTFEKESTEENP